MENACRRILIVEDHRDSADAMAILLGIRGHTVDVARTLGDAVRLSAAGSYDVVFCDIELPDGSGLHLPSLAHARRPDTKFIAVTGHAMTCAFRAYQNAGFHTCLLKPVTPETIYEYVDGAGSKSDVAFDPVSDAASQSGSAGA